MEFYTTHLAAEKAVFGKTDALWTQQSWILFNKTKQPPPAEVVSALFHVGWVDARRAHLHEHLGWDLGDVRWATINAMKSAFLPFDQRLGLINRVIKPGFAMLGADG